MDKSGHWAEINESIARELGWRTGKLGTAKGWRDPVGRFWSDFPDYIGDMNAIQEIFDYCRDRRIAIILYMEAGQQEALNCFCTLWGKITVRAEAFEPTLAVAKAFLILRRKDVEIRRSDVAL